MNTPTSNPPPDYRIHGADMQFVEIDIAPDEFVVAENGTMMYMQQGIQMDTRISDGSDKNSGMLGSVIGAAKRHFSGEDLFLAFFTNKTNIQRTAAFAAPYPGMIVPLPLAQLGGKIMCCKGAFLCATQGTAINIGLTKRLGAGFFGGEGFLLQKIEGNGIAFIHSGGTIIEKELVAGEKLYVDTGSLVAFQTSVDFDVKMVTGMKNIMFGGEEFFLSTLQGPGKVWVQSLPYTRLVKHLHEMIKTLQQAEKKKK